MLIINSYFPLCTSFYATRTPEVLLSPLFIGFFLFLCISSLKCDIINIKIHTTVFSLSIWGASLVLDHYMFMNLWGIFCFCFRPNFLPRITLANIWEPASREACDNNIWEIIKASFDILFAKSTLQVLSIWYLNTLSYQ